MPRGRGSMRDRVERLRAEAAATEREREEKRKARELAGPAPGASQPSRRAKQPAPGATRMKVVWAICDRRADTVKTFPFPKKAEAEAELARMNAEADFHHQFMLLQTRVPLEA